MSDSEMREVMLEGRTVKLTISLLICPTRGDGKEKKEKERVHTVHLVNQIKHTTQASKQTEKRREMFHCNKNFVVLR